MPLISSLNCLLATIGKSFVYFSSYRALFSVTSEFDGISYLYQCLGGQNHCKESQAETHFNYHDVCLNFWRFRLNFAINISNNKRTMTDGVFTDYPTIPYFKGFYDVIQAPFSTAALLNFWLPLLLVLAMVYGIVTKVMPNYYREAFYISNENKAKQTKNQLIVLIRINHWRSCCENITFNVTKCNFTDTNLSHAPDVCDAFYRSKFVTWHRFL